MKPIVIDASVVVKWFLEENDSDKALTLRDLHVNGTIQLHAPYLILYEVLNALKYSYIFSQHELKQINDALLNYRIHYHIPQPKTANVAIDIAVACNTTIYDSYYMALGIILKCDVITADKKLINAIKKSQFNISAHSLDNIHTLDWIK